MHSTLHEVALLDSNFKYPAKKNVQIFGFYKASFMLKMGPKVNFSARNLRNPICVDT